ncbi:MAG: cobyrinic acid a,c-diamide synthase [Rhodobacteraceae bacterium]|nr:MAG: cobyrinic acid a,c-diamide synthase [Paracoccaceae bacterium]
MRSFARFMIAAAHKSSGKTVISTGLTAALRRAGDKVSTFKKGPDYIDPMWLGAASDAPCYNLDFNTADGDDITRLFTSRARDLSLVEANKGLFDGVQTDGRDSNAAVAKLLGLPVILVIDTTGMTRGIAPLLQGYQGFDADVNIAGVILNKVGGARHEGKLRQAVETYTDLSVVGSVWRNDRLGIGERHLGLTTPSELSERDEMIDAFAEIVGESVDLDAVRAIARTAPDMQVAQVVRPARTGRGLRIGVVRDAAFGFYYPDDLEAFEAAGATLVFIDALKDAQLPAIDGLFIGGGFPEVRMAELAANSALRENIRTSLEVGLPCYAECGGLMYLCEDLSWQGQTAPMVGLIRGRAVMHARPQGRGYARYTTREAHPWGPSGAPVKAHEFHYASIENLTPEVAFARDIQRGVGVDGHHDGVIVANTLAGFCHLRNSDQNPWVARFLSFVASCKNR